MIIQDGVAEAVGVVMKPDLPVDIAGLRMNLIHRIIEINDSQKCFYMRLVEKFIKQVLELISCDRFPDCVFDLKDVWEKIQADNPITVDSQLRFAELMPKVQAGTARTLGLQPAACAGEGRVIKLIDADHPDNLKNR